MSVSRQQRAMRRERRDEPPVCVASLSVQVEPAPVTTAESRASDEALLQAIAAEQAAAWADAPDRGPSAAPGRPARTGLGRLLTLVGRGLDAWRSAPSETTQAKAAQAKESVEKAAGAAK